jgi:hypothetical protein
MLYSSALDQYMNCLLKSQNQGEGVTTPILFRSFFVGGAEIPVGINK